MQPVGYLSKWLGVLNNKQPPNQGLHTDHKGGRESSFI